MLIKKWTLLIILCLGWGTDIHAQNKVITLEEAVLKQRKELAPERINQLKWVKNTDAISYVKEEKGEQFLMVKTMKPSRAKKSISLSQLNVMMKSKGQASLKKIPAVNWLNDQEFFFEKSNAYFICNPRKGKLTPLENDKKDVANFDFELNKKHLAYTSGNNLNIKLFNGETLKVTNETDTEIVSGQAVHRYEFGISKGTFWSTKGNYLAFYRNDQHGVWNYPLVDNLSMPASVKNIKYPMAGTKNEEVSIGIYNLSDKSTIFLKTEADFEYLTNIAWGPAEKFVYVAVLNRDQNHMKLNQYDVATGDFIKTLLEEDDPTYVEPLNPMIFLDEKEQDFLWLSRREEFMHLYHFDANGDLINKLTEGEWLVKKVLGLDESKSNVYVEGTGTNATEVYLYKANINSANFEKLPGEPGVHRGLLSSSGSYLIDEYSNIDVPRKINVIDTKGKVIDGLLTAADPLKSYKIRRAELFTIDGEGGMPLHCRMIKPTDFDESVQYPTLVYVYNGPHVQLVQNRWLGGAPMWMYHLAEKGYVIFTLDGRGSANRGATFEKSIFRNLGTVEIEDQMRGVAYLKGLKYIDQQRMAIHGWSYGGFMTTSIMLKKPEVFKVGVAGGPVIDWKYYEIMYTERYMDSPEQNPEGFKNARLTNYVNQLEGDLLMIHGLQDDVVVPQHNLSFIRECVKNGVQVDFFPYPTHPHNVRGEDRVHLMEKVIKYIEEKL